MALKYGDLVQKVQKSRDGTLTRVNATVLASSVHELVGVDRKPLLDANGQPQMAEHVDLAFADPGLVQPGQALKTRNVDSIFRLAYDVAPYEEGMAIGYENTILPANVGVKILNSHASMVQTLAVALENTQSPEDIAAQEAIAKAHDVAIEELKKVSGELAKANDAAVMLQNQVDQLQAKLKAAEADKQLIIEGTVGDDSPSTEAPQRQAEEATGQAPQDSAGENVQEQANETES